MNDKANELIDQEMKRLGKQVSVCQKVYMTLSSEGWRDILEPLIDRMIIETVGGKIGDTWVSGKLDRAKTEEKREFYIGYKQALIDFIGRAKFHNIQLPLLEEKMKRIISDKTPKFTTPMKDTRYAEKE